MKTSEIKTWGTEVINVQDVIPMPENERFIDKKNFQGLRNSIQRFGLVELPIWNRTTKHLVGGHQRFYSLKETGIETIEVIVVELSPEDELAANLTMNNPCIQGEWSESTSELLHCIESQDQDLYKSLNMDILQKEVDKLLPKMPNIDPESNFQLPQPDFDTVCPCCGEKWTIGVKDLSVEEIKPKEVGEYENE